MTMGLLSRISGDFTAAMKAKDQQRLGTLRMLKSALTMLEKELRRPVTDDDALTVLLKEAKQRADSITEFAKAGRQDLVQKEEAELAILKDYLPQQLSEAELAAAVDAAVVASGAASLKDMNKVMQAVMNEFKGRVDGKTVSALVRARLGGGPAAAP